ncbi:hypothetical protein GEV33_004526 [Tenebrio molitor]|uniref:ODAD1 central coiled coil region domain-containing protein n=1 Tax=Tenebrio molitor TaxID=7067 RepID=A0A8J6HP92_TENMO|nr:hypothetical protein GEV33_004526 [Tenebrio molitor]
MTCCLRSADINVRAGGNYGQIWIGRFIKGRKMGMELWNNKIDALLKRRKPVLTEEEKYQQSQRVVEKELTTLKRQYVVLDRACSHSQFVKSSKLVKGDKGLAIFQKEHENILKDLTRAVAPGRIREEEKDFDHLSRRLEDYKKFNNKVTKYKIYIEEIDGEIKICQKAVQLLRKQQITDRQDEDRVWAAIKTVQKLENKLETQMIQFGTICTKNKQLRSEIDHLLCLRRVFMTYNQREEWCTKLQILRTRALHDLTSNLQEMREHKRKLDGNRKLGEFFLTKGQKRIMMELEEKEEEKRKELELELREKLDTYQHMMLDIEILHETRIHQQRKTLEELEDVLEETEGEASESETMLKENDEIFKALVQGVSRLFEMCKFSKDPLFRLLGNSAIVKFYNILLYLEALEKTIHQYSITVAYRDKVTDEKKHSSTAKKTDGTALRTDNLQEIEEEGNEERNK